MQRIGLSAWSDVKCNHCCDFICLHYFLMINSCWQKAWIELCLIALVLVCLMSISSRTKTVGLVRMASLYEMEFVPGVEILRMEDWVNSRLWCTRSISAVGSGGFWQASFITQGCNVSPAGENISLIRLSLRTLLRSSMNRNVEENIHGRIYEIHVTNFMGKSYSNKHQSKSKLHIGSQWNGLKQMEMSNRD